MDIFYHTPRILSHLPLTISVQGIEIVPEWVITLAQVAGPVWHDARLRYNHGSSAGAIAYKVP